MMFYSSKAPLLSRFTAGLVACLALLSPTTGATQDNGWQLWQQPGVHAIMRHANAPGFGDPEGFTLGQCTTQRNLDETGREDARALGRKIKQRGIEFTAIYSSQWCRCLETAKEMNVGPVAELPALNSFFQDRSNSSPQTKALKAHASALKPTDKVLYVTHQVNTTALTGVFPAAGEVVLFKIGSQGEVQVLGRLDPESL
jgi:phosphohistidine phosphatase SixA